MEDTVELVKREVAGLFVLDAISDYQLKGVALVLKDPESLKRIHTMRENGMTVSQIVDFIVSIAATVEKVSKKFN